MSSLTAVRVAWLFPGQGSQVLGMSRELAERYRSIFQAFVRNRDKLDRVTFWGVDDGQSWLNNWPVPRRTNHPLLFDRNGAPKPAFDAVIKAAGAKP